MRPQPSSARWLLSVMVIVLLVSAPALSLAQDTSPPAETPEVESAADEPDAAEAPESVDEPDQPAAQPTPAEPGEQVYIVQRGDTLTTIARRFNTTPQAIAAANGIVNPNLIFAGQRLVIPSASALPPPTATPAPPPTTYRVAVGDTLFRIALRFNTTVSELQRINNIRNPNLIFAGQIIRLSEPDAPAETATVAPPTVTATPAAILPSEPMVSVMASGVVAFVPATGAEELIDQASALGVEWVRLNVFWRELEPTQGQIDFATLDPVIDGLTEQGLSILLTVSASPTWARQERSEQGPPDDYAVFGDFLTALASRYQGRVSAYQIWREPNLRREWASTFHPISAQAYINLLTVAHQAIKAADPGAMVITAGLAPTGFNDGVNAIDDRLYLRQMYAANVTAVSDARAAHPGGWGNPPDATCCTAAPGVESHFDSPTFFFLDTLNDYRRIMLENGDNTPLWVTAFGWGSIDGTTLPPPSEASRYVLYNTQEEQALYIVSAFSIGEELGFVQAMFIDNLNGCVADTRRPENCYNSLIAPNGAPRPAYNAVSLRSR